MIDKVSEIRTYLMGIAILWIMLFHTSGIFVFPQFVSLFQKTGFYGVDIFFFVSAYGLYYSMKHQQSLSHWYFRRVKRIIPSFLLVATLFGLVKGWTICEFANQELFLGFFLPWKNMMIEFWYIPSALMFYLFFPLLYRYLYYIERYLLLIFLLSAILLFIGDAVISPIQRNPYIVWFIARIPIFIIGMVYAKREVLILTTIRKKQFIQYCVLFVSLLLFLDLLTGMYAVPGINGFWMILLSLPVICYVCMLLRKYAKFLNPVIEFCGRYSLELYLLHIAFYKTIPSLDALQEINSNYTYLCSFLLAFPCAYILKKSMEQIVQ